MRGSKVVYAPSLDYTQSTEKIDVFLAGSIEMGKAADWQTMLGFILSGEDSVGCVFNPRRRDWDSSWEQTPSNPNFLEQVNWELDHIEKADIVFFNFVPDTKSPITLAELGLVLGKGIPAIVCCPKEYWRAGNVEIMCRREGVMLFDDYEKSVEHLISTLDNLYSFMKRYGTER